MNLAHSSNGLSLPTNFAEDWLQKSDLNQDGHSESLLNLTLHSSQLQHSISTTLTRIGFNHAMEYTISMKDLANIYSIKVPPNDISIFSIDIANVDDKIAIEVDGPTHYLTCIQLDSTKIKYEEDGSTTFKKKLLRLMGWKVLTIPYWEWQKCNNDSTKQEQYCHQLLASISK
jgi:very-short-patch-repair endonuclease